MNWRVPAVALSLCMLSLAGMQQPVFAQGTQSDAATLDVTVTGIKNPNGVIRLALCPAGTGFPDCGKKAARTETLRIENGQAHITLTGLTPGSYAVSVFHDANSNGKLDTFAGVPKEGYGFSRNPPFRPRAPRFSETEIAVNGPTTSTIALRYIL